MYNSIDLIKEIKNKLHLTQKKKTNIKAKSLSKLDSKKSKGNINFNIQDIKFGKLILKIKNRKTKYLFNDAIYNSNEVDENSPFYKPIEEKLKKISKSKEENFYKNIIPYQERRNIFFRKLKPTPFEKNLLKKKSIRNAILMRQIESNYNLKNNISLPSVHNVNLSSNLSFNKSKTKILLQKPKNYFNLSHSFHQKKKKF